MSRRGAGVLAVTLFAAVVRAAEAQPRLALRAEAAHAERWRGEAGAAVVRSVGTYLRAEAYAARDVWLERASDTAAWRGEAIVRFMMDPLAEQRLALSLGGGLGYRQRAYVVATLDLEGPRLSGLRPALALTLGGGSRVGFVVRQAARDRR